MSIHALPELEQGTKAWHDQRRGLVTASVVGQLLTIGSPNALTAACPACLAKAGDQCLSLSAKKAPTRIKTAHDARAAVASAFPPVINVANNDVSRSLTALLVAERLTGHTDPTWVSADMMRGHDDEPRARHAYAEHYAPVDEVGFVIREEDTWTLGWSPDGLVGDRGCIEIKSRRAKKQVQTILADEVPAENMAQIMAGLLASGRDWCDYVSYAGGLPLYVKRVYGDERWFDAITAACEQFERTSCEMVARYRDAIVGLPMTERVVELEMVI